MPIPLPATPATGRFRTSTLLEAGDPGRAEVEAFIAAVYAERYGARLASFPPHLLALRDGAGRLQAAVGFRYGDEGSLFVEQYLDQPAEACLRSRLGRPVLRSELVEVGSFASRSPGDAREVIVLITELLHRAGVRWVLFAATRQLRNAFDRLRLATVVLADARAERLGEDAGQWGSYYDAQPQLLFGDIAAGHAFLHRQDAAPLVAPTQARFAGAAR